MFDGLETLFAGSMASALLCLLKAARNRPHIYFVNLFQDYASLKAREMAAKEQEGKNHLCTPQMFSLKPSALSMCPSGCCRWSL